VGRYDWYVPNQHLEVGAVSEQALWEDVAAGLRMSITNGEFKPGDTLPTEIELSDRYRVSRDTVRRALGKLTQQGLLTPGRGRLGRQVRTSKPLTFYAIPSESEKRVAERRAAGVDAWVADGADQGRKAEQRIAVAIEEAGPDVASRLEIPDSELVAVRRRLRTIDGSAHNLNDTYYPRDISANTAIEHPADVPQGTIALMRDMGHVQVRYRDDLETRMPTPDEAERLQIPPGVPVLVQYRIGYTAERPVKVTITVWPGDRTMLVYDFPA
jgi:GntR family transcriptional regulator